MSKLIKVLKSFYIHIILLAFYIPLLYALQFSVLITQVVRGLLEQTEMASQLTTDLHSLMKVEVLPCLTQ
nr:hypothetical protein [Mycoplasmopsis bovis]